MVNLGHSYKPIIQTRYPHMMPEDTIIWKRFCGAKMYLPDEVWYDVRVGKGIHVDSGMPAWMKKMAGYTTRKRIDIVGRRGTDWYVIEAKPKAGIVAFGQALFYSYQFDKEYKPPGRVIPAVVTDSIDPDLVEIFDLAGVVVFEVGRALELEGTKIS